MTSCPSGEKRGEKLASVATATAAEFETGQPQLVAGFERAEEAESGRRHAAVPIVGPENVAGHRDRLDATRSRIRFDEVTADERTLQSREEFNGRRRVGRQSAIEAAFGRSFPDEGPEHRQLTDMSRSKHKHPAHEKGTD